jgi:hypothetical protein
MGSLPKEYKDSIKYYIEKDIFGKDAKYRCKIDWFDNVRNELKPEYLEKIVK